eukprot:1088539-Rhodomonas_salina.6
MGEARCRAAGREDGEGETFKLAGGELRQLERRLRKGCACSAQLLAQRRPILVCGADSEPRTGKRMKGSKSRKSGARESLDPSTG